MQRPVYGLALAALFAITAASCRTDPAQPAGAFVVVGTIVKVTGEAALPSVLVEDVEAPASSTLSLEHSLIINVGRNTAIRLLSRDGLLKAATPAELRVGLRIRARHTGIVLRSLTSQVNAKTIEILDG
jgi:hypothetical protein